MLGGVKDIAIALGRGRFPLTRESELQIEMDAFLRQALPGVEISREHRLGPADRPDWLIDGRFVVEAKIRGAGRRLIERQVQRYAAYPEVEGIVLATGKSMPPIVAIVPVVIVHLGKAWL
jgi:hypothetical protein